MNKLFKSYTIVPEDYYVERSADSQLRQIIDDMERPGYVLVPRQMGKTNLLMHAKRLLENRQNIFVYLDFSTLVDLDEECFFKHIIDTTIETHEECFKAEKLYIEESRELILRYTTRQYTKELRILSRAVEKIVFIMDEIDALTKVDYSDKVFSQIRSDYFQRTNYHELEKITYILSGVIEPKDIIKNPNISPFNIGQKIYLTDFNIEEYREFLQKTKIDFKEELIERLFFWTNGNPRMTWDLCVEINKKEISKVIDLDNLVEIYYLEAFDKAPIDHIRDLVKRDSFIRDALIQIHYGMTSSMDASIKQRLYLAGIVEYNREENVTFKNPILKKALSLEWLMQLQVNDNDHLEKAYKLIHLEKSYSEAIILLNKYIELKNISLQDKYKAYLYLGECYFRTYDIKNSQKFLAKIEANGMSADILEQVYLLQGYNYTNTGLYTNAIECFNNILKNINCEEETTYKAMIGKSEALVKTGNENLLADAQAILSQLINCKEDDFKMQYMAQSYTILSSIEHLKKNHNKAIELIDYAIRSAQDKERPILYYHKLKLLEETGGDTDATIVELLTSLKSFKSRPDIEDFDNTLGLNIAYVALILSEIIVNRKRYTKEIAPYLRWLNESKEAAYNSICKILCNISDDIVIDFAKHILQLSQNGEWNFGEDHLFNAWAAIYLRTRDVKDAINFYNYITSIKFDQNIFTFIQHDIMSEMLINLIRHYIIEEKSPYKAQEILAFFKKHYINNIENEYYIYSLYYDFIISIHIESYPISLKIGSKFIAEANKHIKNNSDTESLTYAMEVVRKKMEDIVDKMRSFGILESQNYTIGRNTKVTVQYLSNNIEATDKYKKLQRDIDSGLCKIIKIFN